MKSWLRLRERNQYAKKVMTDVRERRRRKRELEKVK